MKAKAFVIVGICAMLCAMFTHKHYLLWCIAGMIDLFVALAELTERSVRHGRKRRYIKVSR